MDVILDEARKRDMKVWILDDSHFPTGYANGALKNYPDSMCKQNIFMTRYTVAIELEPLKSIMIVFDDCSVPTVKPVICEGEMIELTTWTRSLCESVNYPAFEGAKTVTLPDIVSDEHPEFSGFIRYETEFTADKNHAYTLEITDAMEGVEVFVNDKSLGIQIAPGYRYDLTENLTDGANKLTIEVATTAEREVYTIYQAKGYRSYFIPEDPTGITGTVRVYRK